ILCLAMLIAMTTLLASCGDEEEPTPNPDDPTLDNIETGPIEKSETTATIDMTGYKIIRPAYGTYTNVLKQQAVDLSGAITEATRATIRINDDNGSVSSTDLEILLGFGGRDVASQALSEITGNGWIIRAYPDQGKIVIGGTTEFLTGIAINYFIENYLENGQISGSSITINDKVICNDIAMTEVVGLGADGTSYEGKFSVVYRDGLDDKNGSIYGDTPYTSNYDKPYEFADKARTMLMKATAVKGYTLPFKYDSAAADDSSGKGEILVGSVNRPDCRAVMNTLNGNQYALVVKDNQIILGAHNDSMLALSYELFNNMIEQSTLVSTTGQKYILVPSSYSCIKTDDSRKMVVDFPQPDNVDLIETADVGNNSLLHVFTGDGVSREGYVAYCNKLENAGYEVISEEFQLEGSSFRTYLNKDEKITLHVSHQAHSHAAEQKVSGFVNSIRVVSASTKSVDVDEDLFNKDRTWTKVTDSMITNYELHRTVGVWGNSYIFTLEDGSFIIYDGGYGGDANIGKDEDYLYNVLADLHVKIYGSEPTRDNPIRISAWLMSHEHGDHFGVMKLFFKKYGPSTNVRIERLMCNTISAEERVNSYNPETQIQNNLEELCGYADGCDAIKVHTGETYYLANVAIRILYTHEDLFPVRLGFFNNSSTVYQLHMNSTDAAKGTASDASKIRNTETVVMLGDLERNGSKCLRSMFGSALESDMVQVAHHGYNGCEEALYKLINPEVVWFPCNSGELKNHGKASNANSSNWITCANYGVLHEIERVKLIVSGGDCNTNDLGYNLTLILTVDGPDYENLYDALNHKVVETEPEIPAPGSAGGYVIYRNGSN
ncbi:MAG: hypothetical protein IJY22_07885, partial [Clostridia bacterium]|nr:hypothetical protein [Clostridia bacterium]